MPPIARIGDMSVGVCVCHNPPIPMVGFIITGSGDTPTENSPTARLNDISLASCGHTGIIVTGASKTNVNNRPMARLTDLTVGCFISVIVTGASKSIEGS